MKRIFLISMSTRKDMGKLGTCPEANKYTAKISSKQSLCERLTYKSQGKFFLFVWKL